MKLIGIEFDDYASFDKQFVRLGDGINLIVGRNNAGKTALLRGISLINAIRGSGTFSRESIQYVRDAQADQGPIVRLVFELDEETAGLFLTADAFDYYFREYHTLVSFELEVTQGGACFFAGADLLYGDSTDPVFSNVSQQLHLNRLASGGAIREMRQLGASARRDRLAPHNRSYFLPIPDFVSRVFRSLPLVFLVDAHRVPQGDMNLRAEANLSPDGSNLANFLHSLQGSRERDKFTLIEEFLIAVFPEFARVNPETNPQGNTVAITLTERGSSRTTVPLTQCGTGVEQILCLATFVITGGKMGASEKLMFLLDEPHSYLHPDAERQLLAFLNTHPEHAYVVATHSPILVNAVPPGAITYVERGRSTDVRSSIQKVPSEVMQALGYENSDFLFHNRLVFVEGESDQVIIPKLLAKEGSSRTMALAATGFPIIYGVPGAGRPGALHKNARGLQDTILKCEKFLAQFGRAELPHFFLLDGDFTEDDRTLLDRLKDQGITVRFLKRFEVENYLLDPSAIVKVINQQLRIAGCEETATDEKVAAEIGRCFVSEDDRFFPLGKKGEPICSIKGSALLDCIFEKYDLPYRKKADGLLLAETVDPSTTGLPEIWGDLNSFFG
jgi:predicted ATPase